MNRICLLGNDKDVGLFSPLLINTIKMKKLIFLIFAIVCLMYCKNRDQDFNTLPEVTDWGANTAGALVDGKVWVATTDRLNTANGSGTYCEKFNNNYTIELDLRQEKNSYNNAILIKVLIIDLELNKKYDVIKETPDSDYSFAIFMDKDSKSFSTKPDHVGSITISKIDINNQIVSGAFNFNAIDKQGNAVKITDGRFD